MKNDEKEGLFILVLIILIFGGLMLWNKLNPIMIEERNYYIIEEEEEYYRDDDDNEYDNFCDELFQVVVTKYNPVPEQCDSDPLITADGSFIDTLALRRGELKWIAVSRDLRKHFHYGDTVILKTRQGEILGEYVVRDTMNPRWNNRVDILSPTGDSLGKWDNVWLYKKEGY